MAESLNRDKDKSNLNDDILKLTLKEGLEQIKASEVLIEKTLKLCEEECYQTKENSKRKIRFYQVAYRLGAPLAACILIFILITGNPGLFSGQNTSKAPMQNASMRSGAAYGTAENDATLDKALEGNGANYDMAIQSSVAPDESMDNGESVSGENYAMSSEPFSGSQNKAGEPEAPPADRDQSMPAATPVPDPNQEVLPATPGAPQAVSGSDLTISFSEAIPPKLMSLQFSTQINKGNASEEKTTNAFKYFAESYNTGMQTKYAYDINESVKINTLLDSGVTSKALLSAKSYHDLLSDKNYWGLPLRNASGHVAVLLAVTESEKDKLAGGSGNPVTAFTENGGSNWLSIPLAFSINAYDADKLIDADSIVESVRQIGENGAIKEIAITDIYNGSNFMVFAVVNGKEYAIPFLFTLDVGVVNGKAYAFSEMVKVFAAVIE